MVTRPVLWVMMSSTSQISIVAALKRFFPQRSGFERGYAGTGNLSSAGTGNLSSISTIRYQVSSGVKQWRLVSHTPTD